MSPHDPEVVDAPEAMKRAVDLGNDHEEPHNAKLGPDGYFTGFFHKDYEGKFAQQRHHHKRRHHTRDNSMVQIKDHDNDSDDIPTSYEADGVHALPQDGQSDYDLVQTDSDITAPPKKDEKKDWGGYFQHQANQALDEQNKLSEDMEVMYTQEEEENSYEFV